MGSLLDGVPLDVLHDHVLGKVLKLPDELAVDEEQQRGNIEHVSHVLYRRIRFDRVAREDDGSRAQARRVRRRGNAPVQAGRRAIVSFFSIYFFFL